MKKHRDNTNSALMNFADYENKETVKNLFRNYNNLYRLAHRGDMTALSIYLDLQNALQAIRLKEREYIYYLLIQGYTHREFVKVKNGNSPGLTRYFLDLAIKNAQKYLRGNE